MLLGDTEHRLYSPEFEDKIFVLPDPIYRDAQTELQSHCVCQGVDIIYFFKTVLYSFLTVGLILFYLFIFILFCC